MCQAAERDKRIQRFNNDPDCRVFLSSDAGAYGINLNQGSHLICYDLPWSAGALPSASPVSTAPTRPSTRS